MATKQITTRVDEDLLEKVQVRINKIKEESRGGTEINLSTVIRYALEKYLEEQNEIDRGVINVKFELDKFSLSDLEKLNKITSQLSKTFNCGWEDTIDLVKSSFKLDQAVKYAIYERNNIPELSEKEKELIEKYKKEV